MPYVFEANGRTAVVEDNQIRRITDRLIRITRRDIWARIGGSDSMFEHWLAHWEHHRRFHTVNIALHLMEALGAADLPRDSFVNGLKREKNKLSGLIRPNCINKFYQRLPAFDRKQRIFVRQMKIYLTSVSIGAGRTVQGLVMIRDGSFHFLSALATLLTGPVAGAARIAAATGARALVQDAAFSFIISSIQSSATGLGRMLAGDTVTLDHAIDSTIDDALDAVTNAGLGRIFNRFLGPMTNSLSASAVRQIARGRLAREVGPQLTSSEISGAVTNAIRKMIDLQPGDMRRFLSGSRNERNDRGHANSIATQIALDRKYLRYLEEELNNIR